MNLGLTDFEKFSKIELAELYQQLLRASGTPVQLTSQTFDGFPILEGAHEDQLNILVLVRGLEYFNDINIDSFEEQIHTFVTKSGWDGASSLKVKVASIANIDESIFKEIYYRFSSSNFEFEILDFEWIKSHIIQNPKVYHNWKNSYKKDSVKKTHQTVQSADDKMSSKEISTNSKSSSDQDVEIQKNRKASAKKGFETTIISPNSAVGVATLIDSNRAYGKAFWCIDSTEILTDRNILVPLLYDNDMIPKKGELLFAGSITNNQLLGVYEVRRIRTANVHVNLLYEFVNKGTFSFLSNLASKRDKTSLGVDEGSIFFQLSSREVDEIINNTELAEEYKTIRSNGNTPKNEAFKGERDKESNRQATPLLIDEKVKASKAFGWLVLERDLLGSEKIGSSVRILVGVDSKQIPEQLSEGDIVLCYDVLPRDEIYCLAILKSFTSLGQLKQRWKLK